MLRPRSRLLLSLLALVGLAATGLAQDRPYPPARGAEGEGDVADPFVTPPSLRRAGDGVAFTTTGSLLAALPGLGVRGTLEVADRPPAAILALGPRTAPASTNPLASSNQDGEQHPQAPQERTVVVRAGDRISFVKDGVDIAIDVLAIAHGSVTLRIGGESGPSITLR